MKLSIKTAAALVGVFATVAAHAQADSVKRITVSGDVLEGLTAARATAGASFGSPLAFGADWGDAGAGLFVQTVDGSEDGVDGGVGFVVGLGNSQKAVGLEASLALSSLFNDGSGNDSGFGESGSFGLKLHTALPYGAAFAVGVSSIGRFGLSNDAVESSVYAVGSKVFSIGKQTLVLNLGVGDNAYNEPGQEGVGVFGSGAFYFTKQISAIVDYTGRFLNAGLSVAPIRSQPLTLTLGAINLTERFGTKTELGASLGYGFKF